MWETAPRISQESDQTAVLPDSKGKTVEEPGSETVAGVVAALV